MSDTTPSTFCPSTRLRRTCAALRLLAVGPGAFFGIVAGLYYSGPQRWSLLNPVIAGVGLGALGGYIAGAFWVRRMVNHYTSNRVPRPLFDDMTKTGFSFGTRAGMTATLILHAGLILVTGLFEALLFLVPIGLIVGAVAGGVAGSVNTIILMSLCRRELKDPYRNLRRASSTSRIAYMHTLDTLDHVIVVLHLSGAATGLLVGAALGAFYILQRNAPPLIAWSLLWGSLLGLAATLTWTAFLRAVAPAIDRAPKLRWGICAGMVVCCPALGLLHVLLGWFLYTFNQEEFLAIIIFGGAACGTLFGALGTLYWRRKIGQT